MQDVIQQVFDFFARTGSEELALFLVSMIPLIELRGSVLLGAAMGMNWLVVLGVSLVGNILPIPFAILFGEKILHWLQKIKFLRGLFTWYENHLLKKAHEKKLSNASLVALCLFVGIPLPGTGAWSGAVIAALLDMPVKKAFFAIALGVLLAGIIMTIASYGLFGAINLFG